MFEEFSTLPELTSTQVKRILNNHGCMIIGCENRKDGCCTPTKNFVKIVGIKSQYSEYEIYDFLGY